MKSYLSTIGLPVFLICSTYMSFAQGSIDQLILAIHDSNVEKVTKILESGVDANGQSKVGITPLIQATWGGDMEIVKLLVASGADVNLNTVQFGSALYSAACVGNMEVVEFLVEKKADIGFVVDPDVDRLAIVCEDGSMFGEEYTLVAVADYVLSQTPGSTVSNMSSTRALKEISERHGVKYFPAAVGEVNVVTRMKEQQSVIGGEGNGGVIYPELHFGRDALVGIALFLTHLAKSGLKTSGLRKKYPDYVISKNKIEIAPGTDVDKLFEAFKEVYSDFEINTEDGVKVDMDRGWIQLRKSNTEPVIRLYAEGKTESDTGEIAKNAMQLIQKLLS